MPPKIDPFFKDREPRNPKMKKKKINKKNRTTPGRSPFPFYELASEFTLPSPFVVSSFYVRPRKSSENGPTRIDWPATEQPIRAGHRPAGAAATLDVAPSSGRCGNYYENWRNDSPWRAT